MTCQRSTPRVVGNIHCTLNTAGAIWTVSRRSLNVKFLVHPPPRLPPFSPLFVRRKLPVLFGRKIQSRFPSICRLAEASQPPCLLPSLLPLCFSSLFFISSLSFNVPSSFLLCVSVHVAYIRENVSGWKKKKLRRKIFKTINNKIGEYKRAYDIAK